MMQRLKIATAPLRAAARGSLRASSAMHVTPSMHAPVRIATVAPQTSPLWLAGLALACVAPVALCDEAPRALSVQEVITLYEQVDTNMRILSRQMMEALAYEIAAEEEKGTGPAMSVEDRALQMSETFEQLLAQVQDSVFRNHYVTKEQVADAMRRMERGDLPIQAADAELIHEYIRKLGRMRWECTGSREPIRRRQRDMAPKPLTTPIPRDVLEAMMRALIGALTKEMEAILADIKTRHTNLKDGAVRQEIATAYMDASKLVTDTIAANFNVSVDDFQVALAYFHDDATFQATMQTLTDAQHERFVALGL
ncbi:hypothetical protein SPRG_03938 [Saprolegnia parasitica CBS 223.65]|uniref:Uncharacterized protein n=1 Tax=Saprolegnia parasitica (strain CBS 223.65) TaxID=695850 RepID=A0A067CWZ4_SAPPC|nr:hypothetical protein SPRG_03938 [Saprolegnia parasitica CBS 223.65]KDO31322.1 hypothetical protein SPRG_03938 [Saprolegnia parasitica CBS 223.65]|eukprot:XP_012197921.1 hypothetical protein SPRG_03938 [Saprolegnia parasitica CBS 223.65]